MRAVAAALLLAGNLTPGHLTPGHLTPGDLAASDLAAGNVTAGAPADGHRIMLGAVGQTRREIQQREGETGHGLEGVRVFRRWNEPLFDNNQRWAKRTGHT